MLGRCGCGLADRGAGGARLLLDLTREALMGDVDFLRGSVNLERLDLPGSFYRVTLNEASLGLDSSNNV